MRCGYPARYRQLAQLVERQPPQSPLRLVAQQVVGATERPDDLAAAVIDEGGEGIVLRDVEDAKRTYVAGRTPSLLKLKERADAEARVVAIDREGQRLKAFVVQSRKPKAEFRLGAGFTEAQRRSRSFVRVGDLVTFKHNGTTAKGVPRHATYLRHRNE